MENIKYFTPNISMDEKFSNALIEANKRGVNILAYNSTVKKDFIKINEKIEVLI